MPPDPFADDPNDPAAFLDGDDDYLPEPLSDHERREVIEDILALRVFRALLEPLGIQGLSSMCPDCEDEHYYSWDLAEMNMFATVEGRILPVHEPSVHLDPDAYRPWEYCQGFADAVHAANTMGVPPIPLVRRDDLPNV